MTPDELLDLIKADREHGATELAINAIEGIKEVALDLSFNDQRCDYNAVAGLIRKLQVARPSMAVISNLLEELLVEIQRCEPDQSPAPEALVANCCMAIVARVKELQDQLIEQMVSIVLPDDVIMTHSISFNRKSSFSSIKRAWIFRSNNRDRITAWKRGSVACFLSCESWVAGYIYHGGTDRSVHARYR